MRFGSPLGTFLGSPGCALAYARASLSSDRTRVDVRWMPRSGYGNSWWCVFVLNIRVRFVHAPEGVEQYTAVPIPYGCTQVSVQVLPMGRMGDPARDYSHVARGLEATDSKRVTIEWAFTPEPINPDPESDGGYTSAWSLTGLAYARNVECVAGWPSRGRLRLLLTVASGTATVQLLRSGQVVASGCALVSALPGTIALVAANASGLAGALTLAADVADFDGDLYVRWPASMQILRDTFSPPTTLRATVDFDGEQAVRWSESADLPGGSYYYRLVPISDTDDAGTASAILGVVIPAPPAAPTALAYKSGAAAATICQFVKSTTVGATYRAYVQHCDGSGIDFDTIAATAIANATQIILPAITGYPGTARVVVRAVLAGLEDQNQAVLSIGYDAAGARVLPIPNPGQLDAQSLTVEDGLTATLDAVYDSNGEAGVATQTKLFSRAPGGAYNYAVPLDTETLTERVAGVKTASLSYTFATPGWYYLRAIAYTAAGTPSAAADCPELLVYVSDTDMPAPTNVSAVIARG
jgi:hypothetical protein